MKLVSSRRRRMTRLQAVLREAKCDAMKFTENKGIKPRRRKVTIICPGVGSYLLYMACVACEH